jgi:hypothetical protein
MNKNRNSTSQITKQCRATHAPTRTNQTKKSLRRYTWLDDALATQIFEICRGINR